MERDLSIFLEYFRPYDRRKQKNTAPLSDLACSSFSNQTNTCGVDMASKEPIGHRIGLFFDGEEDSTQARLCGNARQDLYAARKVWGTDQTRQFAAKLHIWHSPPTVNLGNPKSGRSTDRHQVDAKEDIHCSPFPLPLILALTVSKICLDVLRRAKQLRTNRSLRAC